MSSQVDTSRVHTTSARGEDPLDHNVGLHSTDEGHNEGEQHGEKKSVFKKVKAKAKKIKDSIIKGHGGHDHETPDDDDDDEDDNEMDTHPVVQGVPGKNGTAGQRGTDIGGRAAIDDINVGKEGTTEQRGTGIGGRAAIGGHAPVFDPTTTHFVPGQEETLDRSRIDTEVPLRSENQPHALSDTPAIAQSTGSHSTGNMGVTHKPKLGGVLEKDSHVLKHVGEDVLPANNQAKLDVPTGGDKGGVSRSHGTNIGGRTAIGDHSTGGHPGVFQDFVPTTTHYVPGQEETLGWSRTDTGSMLGSENQPHGLTHRPAIAHSGGLEKDTHVPKHEDVYPADYPAKVLSPLGGAQDTGLGLGEGTAKQHGDYPRGGATMEEESDIPVSKPPVEHQTFDTPSSIYIPGQEETLGWSRTDTERLPTLSEEKPYGPKNTPVVDHSGQYHTRALETGTAEIGESEKFGGLLDRPTSLEKDPHSPGGKRDAENYQTKVTDPTGRGGDKIGVNPIEQQLGKMNMHDKSSQRLDSTLRTGQPEDLFTQSGGEHQKMATGSHDQFSAEPVAAHQFDSTNLSGQGLHDEYEQKPESYTEKISSLASEFANKAKLATGYGVSNETPTDASTAPLDQPRFQEQNPLVGGYGDTHEGQREHNGEEQAKAGSILGYGKMAVSTVQDKVAGLAFTVTSKGQGNETPTNASTAPLDQPQFKEQNPLVGGYGDPHEGQREHNGEEQAKTGSILDYGKMAVSTVQDKVAGLASTVTSKAQGSKPEDGFGSTGATDKGVSVKEYLGDKLKPGEEDKALSKVITEALPLHTPKEENPVDVRQGDGATESVKKIVIKGRVTESEEVADRLGRAGDVSYDGAGPGLASPGKSVMDRIRDATGSWFKGGEPYTEPVDPSEEGNERTPTSTPKETQQKQNVGETKLQ